MPLLHEEARPVYLGHAVLQVAMVNKVTVHSDDHRHEHRSMFSQSCAPDTTAIGGQGSASKWTGTG